MLHKQKDNSMQIMQIPLHKIQTMQTVLEPSKSSRSSRKCPATAKMAEVTIAQVK